MQIVKIISQRRRDFCATMECEHCNNIKEKVSGYDDLYFHNNVIPEMKCIKCGKTGSDDYIPMSPKYGAHVVI